MFPVVGGDTGPSSCGLVSSLEQVSLAAVAEAPEQHSGLPEHPSASAQPASAPSAARSMWTSSQAWPSGSQKLCPYIGPWCIVGRQGLPPSASAVFTNSSTSAGLDADATRDRRQPLRSDAQLELPRHDVGHAIALELLVRHGP